MKGLITPHFDWAEVTYSYEGVRRGIPNELPEELVPAVVNHANNLEIVRAKLGGKPIKINSWYRGLAVNTAVGGAKTSFHMTGRATDLVCPAFGTPLEVAQAILKMGIPFDELIHEFGTWVHFASAKDPAKPLNKVLTYKRVNGKVVVVKGLE